MQVAKWANTECFAGFGAMICDGGSAVFSNMPPMKKPMEKPMSLPYQKKMWPESETVSDNSHLQIDNTADLNREMEEVTEGHVEVDLIVRAAEQSFEGTTALVSLIDEANTLVAQKCCVRSEHMDIASGVFSSQTIREGGFTEVCDARGDRRFSGSPLVTAGSEYRLLRRRATAIE